MSKANARKPYSLLITHYSLHITPYTLKKNSGTPKTLDRVGII